MITDQKIFAMKRQIIQGILHDFQSMLKSGNLKATRAEEIMTYLENRLSPCTRVSSFRLAVDGFCKSFPEFHAIHHKIENAENEMIQEIAQQCMDTLMERDLSAWENLLTQVDGLSEANISEWIRQLPRDLQDQLFDTFLRRKVIA